MSIRAARVDSNHREVVGHFLKLGADVIDTSGVGRGFPDLVVIYRWLILLVEVKAPRGQLNERQVKWHKQHSSPFIFVIRSCEDVTKVICQIDKICDTIDLVKYFSEKENQS